MKRYLYFLFLLIFIFSCSKRKSVAGVSGVERLLEQSENRRLSVEDRIKSADSAVAAIDLEKNDSVVRSELRRAVVSYYDINQFDKLIKLNNNLLTLSLQANDTLSMGKAYYFSGLAYFSKGVTDSALVNYIRAEKIYRKINHSDLGSLILYKAYILYNVGEYVLAESEASLALKAQQKKKNYRGVFDCYILIASSLNEQNSTDEAIYYFNLALKEIERFGRDEFNDEEKESYRVIVYHNLGSVYEKQKQYGKAIEQYKLALRSEATKKNTMTYSRTINSIAKSRLYKGETEGVEPLFSEALTISSRLEDVQGKVLAYTGLADYYKALNDTVKAVHFYRMAYKNAKELGSNPDVLTALKGLAVTDVKKSPEYSSEFVKLSDSIQYVATRNRNKYARIEYETDQLKGQNDALVRKNSFIIGVSVVVLLFVAAIFIIYYLNSRNKELVMLQEQQKANEEIYQLMFEQQERVESAKSEEKNRIAMELHDGILNNIYAVRLNLEFSNKKSDDETVQKRKGYIKELQSLETEIRAVSHDLSRSAKLVQGKDFADMLRFLVNTQKNNFGTQFELSLDKSIDWADMPNTAKVNIYRIIQEALQNINKYSQADNANVDVYKDGRQIVVNINDDGVGFDTSKSSGGIGMRNLHQRTEALNGLLKIESTIDTGTNINVQFTI